MGREGMFDDSGYRGFEECSSRETCCVEAYHQGYADGMEKKQSELCEFCDNEKRDARVRADEREKVIDEYKSKLSEEIEKIKNWGYKSSDEVKLLEDVKYAICYFAEQLKEQK